jgi:hypothetical protein
LLAAAADAGPIDPQAELARLARRLITASEQDPMNTNVARALLDVLRAFPQPEEQDPIAAAVARIDAKLRRVRGGADVVGLPRRGDAS